MQLINRDAVLENLKQSLEIQNMARAGAETSREQNMIDENERIIKKVIKWIKRFPVVEERKRSIE